MAIYTQESKFLPMDIDLAQKAVKTALSGNWKEAVKLNQELLKENPKDTEALNRLARAYAELGNLKRAKSLAERVLKIDPFNKIATKALVRWRGLTKGKVVSSSVFSPEAFLEEPGKTKMVSLLHLGDAKLIAKLDSGDEVRLHPGAHRISVVSLDGKYLGRLPDDLSARLRRLLKAGNEYQVLVKSIEPNDVKVFIREVKRAEGLKDTPSFVPEKVDYISFTPPELVSKKEDLIIETDEEG
ncbi:MAG: tetratricopeptide repeat protein [Patescibacteria group bacterium]